MGSLLVDEHGNEFGYHTVHCWNCKHYEDVENSPFSFCQKQRSCIVNRQLKTLNPVDCMWFESRRSN